MTAATEMHQYPMEGPVMKRRRSLRMLNEHIEASVVRNTALAVEGYAAGLTRGAKFLNQTEVEGSIALFHSSEISLGQLLGKGGFSKVWAVSGFQLMPTEPSCAVTEKVSLARRIIESTAVDYRGFSNYCIKHLDKRLLENPDEFVAAAADLYVEAKYMSRFNHPNILKLRGMANGGTQAFHEGRHDSFFILTDRLSDTLDQRIERWSQQGAPQKDLIPLKSKYALQIASALEYLHERRIVYRDLKPQNVGLKEDGTVQLFDFGLCRELPEGRGFPEETFKMSEAGTKRFMAPEIYLGARYNLKADVYSWAITVYELFSHEKAYSKLSDLEFQTFVLGQGLRPKLHPYELPHNLECLVQNAWTHSIAQRLSVKTVRLTLQAIVDEWEEPMFAPTSPSIIIEEAPLFPSPSHIECELREEQTGPVFTFEEDVVSFEKHVTFKNANSVAEVTLATDASTELDDISISTFDYSLSSLMDLDEGLSASQAKNIMAASTNEAFEFL